MRESNPSNGETENADNLPGSAYTEGLAFFPIPFTGEVKSGGSVYGLAYAGDIMSPYLDDVSFGLVRDDRYFPLPADCLPQKIVPDTHGRIYVFAKKLFNDNIRLFELVEGSYTEIPLRKGMEDYIFSDACYFEDGPEKSLYFTVFNTHGNLYQVYRLKNEDGTLVFDGAFSRDLPSIGGIDDRVTMINTGSLDRFYGRRGLMIMGKNVLYGHYLWDTADWTAWNIPGGSVITEINTDASAMPVYLTYQSEDSTYSLCQLDGAVIESIGARPNEIFTIDVSHDSAGAPLCKLRSITGKADYVANLRAQLERSTLSRLQDTGATMQEGRAPWVQAYYLNALLDLQTPAFDALADIPGFTQLRQEALQRLQLELCLMDQMLSEEGALVSYRYTVNRQPGVFALHIQRILQLWDRYNHYCPPMEFVNRDKLYTIAKTFDGTVEQLRFASPGDPDLDEGAPYFLMGEPMLTSGSIVPYNYMSTWAASMLQRQIFTGDVDKQTLAVAADLLGILPMDPSFADYDEEHLWPYWVWFSDMYTGWTYDATRNMPINKGEKYNASMTYRTIDAEALLLRMRVCPEAFDQALLDYLRAGIANGSLHPCLNSALQASGLDIQPVLATDTLREYLTPLLSRDLMSISWATLAACEHAAPEE